MAFPALHIIEAKQIWYEMFALADGKMYYTYNLEFYTGKQPEGPFLISNHPRDEGNRMVEPISGS